MCTSLVGCLVGWCKIIELFDYSGSFNEPTTPLLSACARLLLCRGIIIWNDAINFFNLRVCSIGLDKGNNWEVPIPREHNIFLSWLTINFWYRQKSEPRISFNYMYLYRMRPLKLGFADAHFMLKVPRRTRRTIANNITTWSKGPQQKSHFV